MGNDLVRHYGKRKYYSVHEVREANRRQKIDFDLACWSHAFFNTHADFDRDHLERKRRFLGQHGGNRALSIAFQAFHGHDDRRLRGRN